MLSVFYLFKLNIIPIISKIHVTTIIPVFKYIIFSAAPTVLTASPKTYLISPKD